MVSGIHQLNTLRLCDSIAVYGHAMPFGLAGVGFIGMTVKLHAPLSVFAQGRSVPISRGSPPTP
jgi:hypothetical protein